MTKDEIDALVEHTRLMTNYIERATVLMKNPWSWDTFVLQALYEEGIALLPKKETE